MASESLSANTVKSERKFLLGCAAAFVICFLTGFGVGTHNRTSQEFLDALVIENTRIKYTEDDVLLLFSCEQYKNVYQFSVRDDQWFRNNRQYADLRLGEFTRIIDTIPLTDEVMLAVGAGLTGGLTFERAWHYAFYAKGVPTQLKMLGIASIVSGYGLGYWTSGIFDFSCRSSKLHDSLQTLEYWRKIEDGVFALFYIAHESCVKKLICWTCAIEYVRRGNTRLELEKLGINQTALGSVDEKVFDYNSAVAVIEKYDQMLLFTKTIMDEKKMTGRDVEIVEYERGRIWHYPKYIDDFVRLRDIDNVCGPIAGMVDIQVCGRFVGRLIPPYAPRCLRSQ